MNSPLQQKVAADAILMKSRRELSYWTRECRAMRTVVAAFERPGESNRAGQKCPALQGCSFF